MPKTNSQPDEQRQVESMPWAEVCALLERVGIVGPSAIRQNYSSTEILKAVGEAVTLSRREVEAEVRERLEGEEFIRRLCERYFGKTGWVESRIPLIREALRESMHLVFEPSPESAFVALGDPTKPPPIKAALDNTPTPEEGER